VAPSCLLLLEFPDMNLSSLGIFPQDEGLEGPDAQVWVLGTGNDLHFDLLLEFFDKFHVKVPSMKLPIDKVLKGLAYDGGDLELELPGPVRPPVCRKDVEGVDPMGQDSSDQHGPVPSLSILMIHHSTKKSQMILYIKAPR